MKKIISAILILISISGFSQERRKLDSLLHEINNTENDSLQIRLYWKAGYEYEFLLPDSALISYTEALEIAKSMNNTELISNSMENIALFFFYQGDYETALTKFNESIDFATKKGYTKGIASGNVNRALIYSNFGMNDEAKTSFRSAARYYKKLGLKREEAICNTNLGVVYFNQTLYDSALECYENVRRIYLELGEQSGLAQYHLNIGNVYDVQGKYDKAIAEYDSSMTIYKTIKDESGVASCYSNLGIVFTNKGDYINAVKNYQRSLDLKEKLNDKYGMASTMLNLGIVQERQKNMEAALEYYKKALELNTEIGDQYSISCCYVNIGSIYSRQKRFKEAEDCFSKSLEIDKKSGDTRGVVMNLAQLAAIYTITDPEKSIPIYNEAISIASELGIDREMAVLEDGLAKSYMNLNKSKLALPHAQKASEILEKIKATDDLADSYLTQFSIFDSLRDYKNAYKFSRLHSILKDSVYGIEKMKAIEELETRYQTEKKQLEIEKLEKDKALQNETIARKDAENKKQRIIIISFIFGFLLILTSAILIYRTLLQKKKAYRQLAEKNEEIILKNEEITAQRDEIEAQRDEITSQRDLIFGQKEDIESSISYAKRIQFAILPTDDISKMALASHFVIFKPKDIVSGDFYWTTIIKNHLFVAVADCTGHGVPGAFMSMLGVSFLNEIVRRKHVTSADQVLNELRDAVITSLKQRNSEENSSSSENSEIITKSPVKDGMDMSLCVIDMETNKCQTALANNPLYIIQNNDGIFENISINQSNSQPPIVCEDNSNALFEIKPDKMPVAIHEVMNPFTSHTFKITKGTRIYLFSDGFPDQFGGENGKKFKYKPFKELILKTSEYPISDQGIEIEKVLDKWMNTGTTNYEQVDDITLLGLEFHF